MAQQPGESAQELRQRAEEMLRQSEDTLQNAQSPEAAQQLLHELRVHQIELEIQNEELRRSQHDMDVLRARYFDLYNLAPVGYITLNEQGRIVEANLTSANLLGVARSELVKWPLSHFIFSEDQDRYYLYCKQLTETAGRTDVCELRMVRADGSFFWANLQAIGIDEVPEYRIVISDCTRQKLDEIEVRASKELWEKTFNAMPEIITIQDNKMHIVRANEAANQFFQVEPGELNGKYCYEVFSGTSSPCSGCPQLKTLKDRGEHFAVITHENRGKTFYISSALISTENGDIQYIVHVAKDVTEQRKMEEELCQAHKMEAMGTLAGGIAHDFNNILAAILGFSEFAIRDLPEDSKAREDIEQVISSGQRAVELVKQILTFSRKAEQQRHPFQPHVIIKEALKMLRSILPTTIAIEEHIDPESGSIFADPTSIHQIVVNLCTNAYHAMDNEKGTLTVSLSRKEIHKEDSIESDVVPGSFVKLSIQDTGSGMDKKTMARIFEPYFTTKETGKGSGLGLAVVYGIVKTLHGFIKVESEPGQGATFSVYIPALEEVAAIPPEQTELKDLPRGIERILVVDDEPIIVSLNTKMLERFGYRVTATTSSKEALEKIHAQGDDFDLVITDQTMPNLSGVELAREILNIKPDMPIILCSGYSSVVTEDEALASGIKRYVMKPLDIRTLVKMIREVLDEN
ncbi:MAG: response regulator [Desulfocapsaceae bacterium]|nr:response regulator [Desulfocapsaceae bacterium]